MKELSFILEAKREHEHQDRVFHAAMQGVDLNKNIKNPVQQKIEEVKRRAAVAQLGEDEVKREEFAVMGFDYGTA